MGKAKFVPDEILVKFKGDIEPFRVLKVPEGEVGEKIKEYLERADVEYAEPNYYAYAFWGPNDEYYSYQWHLNNAEYGGIDMEKAWELLGAPGTPGKDVIVAIVDTGIAYEDYGGRYQQAPDLADTCFVAGYDFVNDDSHPNDDSSPGHGTHVAGTIAQSTNNGIGVAGIAFDACLMPVKVLDSRGSGTYADVADGIVWAVDNGAKVISLSLGGSESSKTLEDAVAYAYNNRVTVIAAAGNDGKNVLSYPAAYDDYVIAVGATRYDKTLAYYSNYGPSLDLVAPGGDLNVDQNNDTYGDGVLQQTYEKKGWGRTSWGYYFMTGTSMAAPHVSGVAALLIANGNATTPNEVRAALQESAEDLGTPGRDDTYGWGLVDAYAALQWTAVDNKRPVANDDSATTQEDTAVTIDVLANDTDADKDTLTVTNFTQPSNGNATLNDNQTMTYTPEADWNGTDSFSYTANDGKADSNVATVTVTVNSAGLTAYVSIDMSQQSVQKWWRVTATVTITENNASGSAIVNAMVDGTWSDAYSGAVSGTTDKDGKVSFRSSFIRESGTVTFTVDKVTKDGEKYTQDGKISDSINGGGRG
jgi:serine protease